MNEEFAFPFVDLPIARSHKKTRSCGVTMVADWGSSNQHLADTLELVGNYIDYAKIVTGTSRLYRRDYLSERLSIYSSHRVAPFIGGQFFEYMLANHGWKSIPRFFDEARTLGFVTIEISENCVSMSSDERVKAIKTAHEHGLSVMAEVGSKDMTSDTETIVGTIDEFKSLDVEFLLLEAAEIVNDGLIREDLLEEIRRHIPLDRILFELPGPWISGVSSHMVHDLRKMLITQFGPDVNLANVHFEEVIATEALRCGLGVVGPTGRRET